MISMIVDIYSERVIVVSKFNAHTNLRKERVILFELDDFFDVRTGFTDMKNWCVVWVYQPNIRISKRWI